MQSFSQLCFLCNYAFWTCSPKSNSCNHTSEKAHNNLHQSKLILRNFLLDFSIYNILVKLLALKLQLPHKETKSMFILVDFLGCKIKLGDICNLKPADLIEQKTRSGPEKKSSDLLDDQKRPWKLISFYFLRGTGLAKRARMGMWSSFQGLGW